MEDFRRKLKKFLINMNNNYRMAFFGTIIVICILSVVTGVGVILTTDEEHNDKFYSMFSSYNDKVAQDQKRFETEFNNLFTNKFLSSETPKVTKANSGKELVYTAYEISNNNKDYYKVNADIPCINLNSQTATDINQKIRESFYDKSNSIMKQKDKYIVYNVSYISYVKDNVLSIAIKASTKEADKAERVIIKTYNLDLTTNKYIGFEDLLAKKNIKREEAQKQIDKKIKLAYNNSKALSDQYKNVYVRDVKNIMYKVENAENYFITNTGEIYVVYPYGNLNETNEIDIVIF